jgi:hypothetical protein
MGEHDHGLHVEAVPKRPGAEKLPVSSAAGRTIASNLHNLSPEAQRSVLAVMIGRQPDNALARAAIETAIEPDDIEASRAGAS